MDNEESHEGLVGDEPDEPQSPEAAVPSNWTPYLEPTAPAVSPAPTSSRFCPACGAGVLAQTVVCPKCGSPVGGPVKDKTVAVLLAVFLTFWTWLYTYQRSKVKFWVGLGLSVLGVILTTVFVGIFILFGVWIWAVVDAATKPQSWYTSYSSVS